MVESVDDAEGLYVAVERCPLCSTSRRRLTCARCVQAGDFVYFDGRNSERFVFGFWSSILAEVRCVWERCSQDETCFCPRRHSTHRHRRRTKMSRVLVEKKNVEMIIFFKASNSSFHFVIMRLETRCESRGGRSKIILFFFRD